MLLGLPVPRTQPEFPHHGLRAITPPVAARILCTVNSEFLHRWFATEPDASRRTPRHKVAVNHYAPAGSENSSPQVILNSPLAGMPVAQRLKADTPSDCQAQPAHRSLQSPPCSPVNSQTNRLGDSKSPTPQGGHSRSWSQPITTPQPCDRVRSPGHNHNRTPALGDSPPAKMVCTLFAAMTCATGDSPQ